MTSPAPPPRPAPRGPRVLCIGAALWDVIGRAAAPVAGADDVPGEVATAPGGVAANIARALAREGLTPVLLAAVGADPEGEALVAALAAAGVDTTFVARVEGVPTGRYVAVEDATGLIAAVADMRALARAGGALLAPLRDGRLASAGRPFPGAVILDGNLDPALLSLAAAEHGLDGADLRIAPASPATAARLRPLVGRSRACLHLNLREAEALCGDGPLPDAPTAVRALLHRGVARALVTDGPRAAAEAASGQPPVVALPPEVARPAHVTGAGDAALAAHLAAELAGATREAALARAVAAGARHVAPA